MYRVKNFFQNKLFRYILPLIAVCFYVGCTAEDCSDTSSTATKTNTETSYNTDQQVTEGTVASLNANQPLHTYMYSQERANLQKRLDTWNKPGTISYIALIDYGKVMATYAVKDKVSSVNSLLTNPTKVLKLADDGSYGGQKFATVPSPDLDGSYGDNPSGGIFFFTTAGQYIEWRGNYLWSNRPFILTTPPEITMNMDNGQPHADVAAEQTKK